MASQNSINNTVANNNFTVPSGTITSSGNITTTAGNMLASTGTVTGIVGVGVGAAPVTSALYVNAANRIGAWITGTNVSAGADADGLFIDASFAPSANIVNAASIGLYPTFNPPGGVTITTGYGLYIASGTQGGAGAVTTGYGLFVTHPTFGTSNFAAQIDNIRIDVNTIAATNLNGTLTVNSAGTGTLSIGTNATAHSTVLGSTTALATTTIQGPSAGVFALGVQGVAVANKNYVTINTVTGALGSDAGAASSISITGDTGGALTGASFTFTGGTTGLSFGGAGTTETLTFAGITANGGTVSLATDATNSTVNIGTGAGNKTVTLGSTSGSSSLALKYGTADFTLASATGTIMSALDTGEITCPLQPAFFAYQASAATNATGDGTAYTLGSTVDLTESYDQNSDFDPTTGTFTAPVTGIYHFDVVVDLTAIGAHTQVTSSMVVAGTSAATYFGPLFNPSSVAASTTLIYNHSTFVKMTATDTITFVVTVSGSTKTVAVNGQALGSGAVTYVSGALIC